MNKYLLVTISAISIHAETGDIHTRFYNALQDYVETPSAHNAQAVVDLYDQGLAANIRRDLLSMVKKSGLRLSALEKQARQMEARVETWSTMEEYERGEKPSIPEPTPEPVKITDREDRKALKRRYSSEVRNILRDYSRASSPEKEAYRAEGNNLFTEINNSDVAKDLGPTLSKLDYNLKLHRHGEIRSRR